jgi:MFS family permease
MIFPFYVLYATDELHIPAETIGVFIFAQTVGMILASLILGRVVDRQGPQRAVQIGTLIVMSAPVLALGLALGDSEVAEVLRTGYAWIYICMGLANNLVFLGFNNYVLEIAPASQRTIYLGALNTINSIGAAGPAFAGWLLGVTSYPVLFAVSFLFGIATLVSALRLPSMRQKAFPAERGVSVSG